MTPAQFVACRPCLEEIDGYLHRLNTPGVTQELLDTDGLKLIEEWRRKLLRGKVLPAETKLPRNYDYKRNHRPVRRARKR